ncbi:cysteine dioxygenase [Planktothrix mougeotii]|uniref:Cysteine dioxygenase family protein n=1 Tax=Planktothrix mougeotii LEGE 06226 TaxID=1828728 RepID=A0ABR9UCK6_9CYAN|nr:cysteine dioxygenase family protein [Planktothrix mougeotii]MBE9143551.1 cysteine dioxygenase family protein [Planktothrix mougeotii LEGE 06226]
MIQLPVQTSKPTARKLMISQIVQQNGVSSPDRVIHPLMIEEFLIRLKQIPSHQLTLDTLKDLVTRLHLPKECWEAFVLFLPDRYRWETLLRNDDVEIVVICWASGQTSGVHPHRNAALNVTKVLQGSIIQQRYIPDEQRKLILWKEETVSTGEITWTDRYEFHQLVNNSAEDCITLHVYSPVRD